MKKFNLLILLLLFVMSSLQAQLSNTISVADKIYGLSSFWQEVNYNFVYLNERDTALWNATYKKLLIDVQNTQSDYEYYRLLQKFCALLKDGHTNVYFPDEIEKQLNINDFGAYQIFLTHIEGKAIITRVNASKKNEVPVGSEIIKVNGIDTQKYMDEYVIPYISSSTEHILRDWAVQWLLEAPWGTGFEITLKLPNNQLKTLTLTAEPSKEEDLFPPFKNLELMTFKWLENSTAYVAINSFNNPKIRDLFLERIPELQKAKHLIIDLRNNGGGNSYHALSILDFLTHDNVIQLAKSSTRQHLAAYKAWGENVKAGDTLNNDWAKKSYLAYTNSLMYDIPNGQYNVRSEVPKVVIPTVVLMGHNTASAAEDFLIYTVDQKHITKIGEPSFGSTGMPMTLSLPRGGEARICTKKDTYPNGEPFVGVGIAPDILVTRTVQDFLKDKDFVLEKAIAFLKQKKK